MANNLTKIIAGLLIAIAVLLGIYAWLLGRHSTPAAASAASAVARTVPMVVATRVLPAGRPITADVLKVAQTATAPAGTFGDPAVLVGRVPVADIPASSPVLASALAGGLAEDIGTGERAVAIKVDATNAVGNRVRPGNFVDVFVNLKRENGNGMADGEVARTQARLLLSRVRVLSFGDATPERDSGNDNNNNAQNGMRIAVIAVPTGQVDALTLGESSGRLTLALRNPRDDEIATQTVAVRTTAAGLSPSAIAAAGVALEDLSGTRAGGANRSSTVNVPPLPRFNAPPARAPGGGGSIEVIRGGRPEMVTY